ncbi:hypothetical protein GBA52_022715 [Prunus armeniaca]|nr:hypothetical protein GBA52_022715 [Prunus armeniaca]
MSKNCRTTIGPPAPGPLCTTIIYGPHYLSTKERVRVIGILPLKISEGVSAFQSLSPPSPENPLLKSTGFSLHLHPSIY